MTNTEKWNLIVEGYQQLYSSLETKIQSEWEMYCAELFGFKKLLHEIDSQRHLSVGSGGAIIPDIILRVNNKDIFDIELKQYSLPFHESFESQLISYLNQTHLSVGMVVCNKIYLYHYEYSTISVNKIEIPFEKDNQDGIALMDMLAKETFSAEKIRNYILKKKQHEQSISEIKHQLMDKDWIKETVKSKLLEKYSEADIDHVLSDFTFNATSKFNIPMQHYDTHVESSKATHIDTISDLDISPIIREWCKTKMQEGELIFLYNNSVKKYTRFTTSDLNEILPYQNDVKSGWKNGHFYTYEIENYSGKFKMFVSFSNVNTPKPIQDVFKQIMIATGKAPQKSNWEWWRIFTTSSFSYDTSTTQETIFKALDSQFTTIRARVEALLKKL